VGDSWAAGGHSTFPSGEFNHALYNLDVQHDGYYTLSPRTYSTVNRYSKWGFDVHLDGDFLYHYEGVGAKAWGLMEPGQKVYLTAGRHKVRVGCWTTTSFQLSGLSIAMAGSEANREALAVILRGYQVFADQASLYTPASYAPFAAAWADAQEAVAGTEATDWQLANIPAALEAAASGLVFAVDYSALQAVIDAAKAKLADPDSYLSTGLAALSDAVTQAEALIASGTATEAQVAAELTALMEAIAQALPKGDRTALTAIIAAVQAMDQSRYTPATWAAVEDALDAAVTVNAKAEASADEVAEAVDALSTALGNLASKATKTALASAISVAETILANASSYVASSLMGVAEALADAQEVYGDPNATQAEVTAAQSALIAKLASVRAKPAGPAPAPLAFPVSAALKAAIDPVAVAAELGVSADAAAPAQPAITAFAKVTKPKIVGTKKVGRTLKVKVGSWSPAPEFSYQWYRGGKPIAKATFATYKLKSADLGKRISVKVTASKAGFTSVVKASAKTAKIK
jgi:hypothetical protein